MLPNKVHTVGYSVLALSLVALGYQLARSKAEETRLNERLKVATEEREKLVQDIESKTRTIEQLAIDKNRVIVVVKPDGTRITETETSSTVRSKDTETASNSKTESTGTQVTNSDTQIKQDTRRPLSVYSLTPEWSSAQPMPTGVSAGVRLGTLPLWLEAGWAQKQGAHLGVRVEW